MSVTTGFAGEEARRGVILSLVASVASSYIQFLGLDEQLDAREQLVNALSQYAYLAKNQRHTGYEELILHGDDRL
jgi:multidrug efflux system outer membrane protein